MPLRKTIRIASLGVPAAFHVIRRYAVDVNAKTTFVDIASFYDKQAAEENLQPIGMANILLDSVAPLGDDPVLFYEKELVASAPKSVKASADLTMTNPNRYLFADAEIVEQLVSKIEA